MKKSKCMILLLILFLSANIYAAECGDVNSSGTIDIVDSLLTAQKYVGIEPPQYDSWAGDVNASGACDIVDALLIAQYYVGLIQFFPGCVSKPEPTEELTPSPTTRPVTPGAGTLDCSKIKEWNSSDHYEQQGNQVYYNGKIYKNKWYSTNEVPESNLGDSNPWVLVGDCDPGLTPAPTKAPPAPVSWSGKPGYATRFWDCCKPHCSWQANVPAGMKPLKTCNIDGKTINPDAEAKSSCEGGSSHVCYNFLPWAIDENLSYGFAATSSGDVCGKCFEIMFTGKGKYSDTPGAVALKNKRMIIMAINIGYDVSGGQFDLLIPGGGVGAFDGCSRQWGIPNKEMGAVYGGLLTACMQQHGYYNHEAIKNCLRDKNDKLFRSRNLTQMATGLDWFIDWFKAADNPSLIYREVSCPNELVEISGLVRP